MSSASPDSPPSSPDLLVSSLAVFLVRARFLVGDSSPSWASPPFLRLPDLGVFGVAVAAPLAPLAPLPSPSADFLSLVRWFVIARPTQSTGVVRCCSESGELGRAYQVP